jgi:hypothetical protein
MRNLTITRTKSFVGCLGKMKVYIEDPMGGDTVISGVNCRKLGDLKNGETVTFPIGGEAARVYVIADQMSKNYSNDYYPLEAGTEDVVLTGKNHFNPGAGNPFRFDGVTDETVLANRKKGGRKGIVVLILAAIFGAIMGRSCARIVHPQDFTVDNMTITLSSEFRETSFEGFTQCYDSRNVAVFVLKEEFSMYPGMEDWALSEYGDAFLWANGFVDSSLLPYSDFIYTTYSGVGENGQPYCYMATIHKSGDAFWLVQFAAEEASYPNYESQFLQWAETVRFD